MAIPIYLINRTKDYYSVSIEDWHSYFMLEVKVDGKWQRAQSHTFSWCGDSYGSIILRPGQHIVLNGFFPAAGPSKAPARFRRMLSVDVPIATNLGQARYDAKDIELSRYDPIAIRCEMSVDDLLNIIEGKAKWLKDRNLETVENITSDAIGMLARRFPKQGLTLYRKWTEQSDARSKTRLYDLMEGLLYSKALPQATVFDWANGKTPLEDAQEIQNIRGAALDEVGYRHPIQARRLIG